MADLIQLFQTFPPLTWVAHCLVWGTFQMTGYMAGSLAIAVAVRRSGRDVPNASRSIDLMPRYLGQMTGFSLGFLVYGIREVQDFTGSLFHLDWWTMIDSLLDFTLPLMANGAALVAVMAGTGILASRFFPFQASIERTLGRETEWNTEGMAREALSSLSDNSPSSEVS